MSIVRCDPDEAVYVGNEEDGAYFQVQEYTGTEHKPGWYVTVWVDCDTAHFTEDILTDDGPYQHRADAARTGRAWAEGWCNDNNVIWS